eukprot:2597469-Amphidinium_carterae.1
MPNVRYNLQVHASLAQPSEHVKFTATMSVHLLHPYPFAACHYVHQERTRGDPPSLCHTSSSRTVPCQYI